MASPPPDYLDKRRSDTRDAAAAFVEDMQHIREISKEGSPGPSRAEMRRLSVILRRLIVDGDLHNVASPRVGRIKLPARDLKSFIALKPSAHLIIGNNGSALTKMERPFDPHQLDRDSKRRVLINLDNFRVQPTLCFHGIWVRRVAVIKFVANAMSGAHSRYTFETTEDRILASARTALVRTVNPDGSTNVALTDSLVTGGTAVPNYDPRALDPVLLDLLSTSELMCESEDLAKLEAAIKTELGLQ